MQGFLEVLYAARACSGVEVGGVRVGRGGGEGRVRVTARITLGLGLGLRLG